MHVVKQWCHHQTTNTECCSAVDQRWCMTSVWRFALHRSASTLEGRRVSHQGILPVCKFSIEDVLTIRRCLAHQRGPGFYVFFDGRCFRGFWSKETIDLVSFKGGWNPVCYNKNIETWSPIAAKRKQYQTVWNVSIVWADLAVQKGDSANWNRALCVRFRRFQSRVLRPPCLLPTCSRICKSEGEGGHQTPLGICEFRNTLAGLSNIFLELKVFRMGLPWWTLDCTVISTKSSSMPRNR